MNPATNEVRSFAHDEEITEGFEVLPKKLQHAAKLKLNGRKSAVVSRGSGGKLSKHAAKLRKQRRRRERAARKKKRLAT